MTKIDVTNLMGVEEDVESIDDMMISQEEAFASRVTELRRMGDDLPVSEDEAKSLATSVLVLSIVKFPELVEEIGIAMGMSAGDTVAQVDLIKTMQCLNTAFAACSAELDIRLPPREEPEEEETTEQ